jgi:transcriptional antiterminator RfaH
MTKMLQNGNLQGNNSWYLLYCKSREEERAVQHLQNQGIESFYATKAVKKIRKGIKSVKLEPLFPNYLFVSLDPSTANFNAIRSTRGISSFIRFGKTHAVIADNLINRLRAKLEVINTDIDEQYIPKKGDVVEINDGIYQGLTAIFKISDGLERSVLLIKLIEQQAELTIDNKAFTLK